MGGPNALISVEESVNGMIDVITTTSIINSGQFINYNETRLQW